MNKKLNYVLFILAATVVNIIIMVLLFIVPFIILLKIFDENVMSSLMPVLYIVLPIVSIAGGYVIYSKIYTFFRQKVDMDKYFEPLFKRRR